jgi:hypothetical protein
VEANLHGVLGIHMNTGKDTQRRHWIKEIDKRDSR